jgi:hypothetical protein
MRLASPAAEWQAIFLGATEPRAARPGKARRGATTVSQAGLAVSISGDGVSYGQRTAVHGRPIQVHFLDNRNFSPPLPFAAARNQEGGCDEWSGSVSAACA